MPLEAKKKHEKPKPSILRPTREDIQRIVATFNRETGFLDPSLPPRVRHASAPAEASSAGASSSSAAAAKGSAAAPSPPAKAASSKGKGRGSLAAVKKASLKKK